MTNRKNLVAAARGDQPFDLGITNVLLVNVLTRTIDPVDIGVVGNRIAAVLPWGSIKDARQVIDGNGLYATPGFVDGHVHNESSMCTPAQWAKVIVPRGTTTVFTDPHEIGNVMGLPGIRYMLAASEGIPMRYFVTAPSCVPAVPSLESAGAVITHKEMADMLGWERVTAIAEAMDYPGLINQKGNITPIVEVGHRFGVPIEGHAPGVTGAALQAYLAATGPRASDHESIFEHEMLEKVKSGMIVYARESTFLNTLAELKKAMDQVNDYRLFGMCTDDIMPHHLLERGHLDLGIKSLIELGVEPIVAYQMATLNVAQHHGIPGLGAIAPGWLADIVLLQDLESLNVRHVIFDGRHIVADGVWLEEVKEPVEPLTENSVHIPAVTADDFVPQANQTGEILANAIDMSNLFTKRITTAIPAKNGRVQFPLPDGVTLASIVPRHGQDSAPSLAFLSGYPLQRGAVASTISHDSHNLAIIGTNPQDMLVAAQEMEKQKGGLLAVLDGKVIARAPLPIAGLMSPLPVPEIAEQVAEFEKAMPVLGLPEAFPVHLLALALPVVPEIRLTDQGLVDVATQEFVPLFQ